MLASIYEVDILTLKRYITLLSQKTPRFRSFDDVAEKKTKPKHRKIRVNDKPNAQTFVAVTLDIRSFRHHGKSFVISGPAQFVNQVNHLRV